MGKVARVQRGRRRQRRRRQLPHRPGASVPAVQHRRHRAAANDNSCLMTMMMTMMMMRMMKGHSQMQACLSVLIRQTVQDVPMCTVLQPAPRPSRQTWSCQVCGCALLANCLVQNHCTCQCASLVMPHCSYPVYRGGRRVAGHPQSTNEVGYGVWLPIIPQPTHNPHNPRT